MYDPMDEFPHTVSVIRKTITRDTSVYPAKTIESIQEFSLNALMDTPSTSESTSYHQRNIVLSQFMYYPYDSIAIQKTDIIEYKGSRFELIGKPENQGGQDEVLRLPLREL